MKIGLLSDTHGFLDEKVFHYFENCDEIWHAGDIGTLALADKINAFKPLKAVYGNIDGAEIRRVYPENLNFYCEGLQVFITHIGGYPPRYNPRIRAIIQKQKPDLYICGHSHILKIMPDKNIPNVLHINPGAAGNYGFHKIKTLVRFEINHKKIENLEVIELGKRGN